MVNVHASFAKRALQASFWLILFNFYTLLRVPQARVAKPQKCAPFWLFSPFAVIFQSRSYEYLLVRPCRSDPEGVDGNIHTHDTCRFLFLVGTRMPESSADDRTPSQHHPLPTYLGGENQRTCANGLIWNIADGAGPNPEGLLRSFRVYIDTMVG